MKAETAPIYPFYICHLEGAREPTCPGTHHSGVQKNQNT